MNQTIQNKDGKPLAQIGILSNKCAAAVDNHQVMKQGEEMAPLAVVN
jgi:hypothetical protein